jgi:parallel beta-helix repeat protein
VVGANGDYGVYMYTGEFAQSGNCNGNIITDCAFFSGGICLERCDSNRIENNYLFGQGVGIKTGADCAGNLILKNICMGYATNYVISTSDTCGPIVTNTGMLATSGADAHPWANFSR